MELIRGKDLSELLKERNTPFETEQVLEWADQILDALEDLHSQDIVHRDIKPSNLKLTPRGRIKLLDFGIAKGAAGDMTALQSTVGSMAAATLQYAPLEQVLRADTNWLQMLCVNFSDKTLSILDRGTDARSDLYALGATLYHLLTNTLPVNAPTRALSIWSGLSDKLRRAHEINPQVSQAVSVVLQSALELEQDDRLALATEFRRLLNQTGIENELETVVADKNKVFPLFSPVEFEGEDTLVPEKEKIIKELEQQRLFAEEGKRAERIQHEREENLRKQKEAEDAFQRQRKEEERLKRAEAQGLQASKNPRNYLLGMGCGIIAMISFMIWMNQGSSVLVSNSTNVVSNKSNSTNKAANTANSSSGITLKNSIGMELVNIPAGTFMMGDSRERTVHKVTISKPFLMGKYEVTQEQWQSVMGSNPSYFTDCPKSKCPVEMVSWDDAQSFISRLNAKNDGYQYRLPTEAEWEYACRAGTTGDHYDYLDLIAWYDKNSGNKTHPAGGKKANAFGLYDMSGNVWEWCQDWYGDYSSGEVTDPTGAGSGQYRVLRGGSWLDFANYSRSALRYRVDPSYRIGSFGFRVAATPR